MSVPVRKVPDMGSPSVFPRSPMPGVRDGALALVKPQRRAIRCLLIEPQAMIRRGLALMLAGDRPGVTVDEASSVDQGIRLAVGRGGVDLVLVDVEALSGGDRMAVLRRLLQGVQPAAVIVTGAEGTPQIARACIAAGARGFVAKSDPSAVLELVTDLLLQSDGREEIAYVQIPRWAIGGDGEAGSGAGQGDAAAALNVLTPRQKEIFNLIQAGCSNKEIARRLGVLEGTVKVHVRAVMGRLGLRNRTQVAILAARAVRGQP